LAQIALQVFLNFKQIRNWNVFCLFHHCTSYLYWNKTGQLYPTCFVSYRMIVGPMFDLNQNKRQPRRLIFCKNNGNMLHPTSFPFHLFTNFHPISPFSHFWAAQFEHLSTFRTFLLDISPQDKKTKTYTSPQHKQTKSAFLQ
jgi:hypothetical protein